MNKIKIGWLAAGLAALSLTTTAGVLIEARTNSYWGSYNGCTWHPGQVVGESQIDGMWSYKALSYAFGSSPSSFGTTTMYYHNPLDGWGYGYTTNKSSTSADLLPLAQCDGIITHSSVMGTYQGVGIAFTNVFGVDRALSLSGSYGVWQNTAETRYVDSWIYVVSGGVTTVLDSSRTYVAPSTVCTIQLATPLTYTLKPGDVVYVALGGENAEGSGHYGLLDGGLVWQVPEPASLALLGLGGLALLRRRRR